MSALFEPMTLRSLTVPNRVWMSPMCMYSAEASGPRAGVPTDFHLQHLASRAAGGVGLVMVEATAVRPDGRITPWDLGLWNEAQQQAFTRITAAIAEHGAVPAIQLGHAGRKASTDRPWRGGGGVPEAEGGWSAVAPSAEAFGDLPAPQELGVEEIRDLVQDFAAAARRALAAGFRVVEIHGAHGYLIHSFLSPVANRRTDAYGGPFDHRARFALEIVDAVRAVWPEELPVFFRVSATDWVQEAGGTEAWTGEDTVRLAAALQEHGVDLLDTSTGGMAPRVRIPVGPGYQVPFAEAVRASTGLPTGAVGLITDPAQAEAVVSGGRADAVLLGRELLRDPYWAHRAAAALDAPARVPVQYEYAL
ncbi:NADH:flavin oxidoreductase/NADH oxidase [Kocuria sp.]|uniref:NADH:flavin oxidoreductase/NADH oxidase n=1 Tax=Kocuria sp. TaxID=1871328 RepID=UPI00281237B7|nr:NADH:flavin oxidoreductase/NADH oxidase [Kocuria sp.]HST72322.1 NADH:flavin oxidoreductase/NADH oxidase [Kocuria rosea]